MERLSPLRNLLSRVSRIRKVELGIAGLAFLLSVTFSVVIYPAIADDFHAVLDSDGYGALGFGVFHLQTLSYYPGQEPTLDRGPLYPLFIALLLTITRAWWPYSVQLAQCLLFAFTTLLVFWMTETLWNRRAAVVAASLCALHPFLIWYTGRIWIEVLATFLFTSLTASTLYWYQNKTRGRAALVGVVLGAATLCKATFLPFVFMVPLGMAWIGNRKARGQTLLVVGVALALVLPWTARNYRLSGRLIPVHLLAGFNVQSGDAFAEYFMRAPLSYDDLKAFSRPHIRDLLAELPDALPMWQYDVRSDQILLQDSLRRYQQQPLFLLQKLVLNGWMFWTLGETPAKSLVISALQLPLVLAFTVSAVREGRSKGWHTIEGLHIALVLLYFSFHLPIFAFARLSVVLVPTMLAYTVAAFSNPPKVSS